MKAQLQTPILYLMFNRPDLVKQTFPQIKAQRPKQLFIGADGPRTGNENDREKCAECRDWAMSQIDWNCEVKTLFREVNLGCDVAIPESITWFFDSVKDGIILEDDCLPDETFFNFCSILLDRFRSVPNIMHISGNNFQDNIENDHSYYFSKYSHSWGWASWSDRWSKFETNQDQLIDLSDLAHLDKRESHFWKKKLNHENVNWDVSWQLTLFLNQGVAILPQVNLVSNIGASGVHFSEGDKNPLLFMTRGTIENVHHPIDNKPEISTKKDRFTFDKYYQPRISLIKKLKKVIRTNRLVKRNKDVND
ncbi:MAG: nucleotide-diphospho-sugar transferase [Cyclobacteriaceae bacterium]